MDYIDDNVTVTATSGDNYSADKRAKRRFLKHERIRSRVWELDFIRGICVILMIFDHFMFDIGYMFADLWYTGTGNVFYFNLGNWAIDYWNWQFRLVVQYIVICLFFSICGISCTFSRSNFRRGAILFGFAMLITLVTYLVSEPILFGVIHMLSVGILLVAVIDVISRHKPKIRSIICISLAVLLIIIEAILEHSDITANNNLAFISQAFVDKHFLSMDYFPLLPYSNEAGHSPGLVAVLVGVAIAPLLYPRKRTLISCLDTQFRWYRPVNFFGRHAAEFYLLHQVIWAGVLGLYTIIAIPNGWQLIVDTFF